MAERWTPERLVYGLQQAADPQVSPDGARVVYALSTASADTQKTTSQLWICAIDGGNARQLTGAGSRNGLSEDVGRGVERAAEDQPGAKAFAIKFHHRHPPCLGATISIRSSGPIGVCARLPVATKSPLRAVAIFMSP